MRAFARSPYRIVLAVAVLSACADESPLSVPAPPATQSSAAYTCTVDVRAASMSCKEPGMTSPTGVDGAVVFGGQSVYVQLTSANNNSAGGVFTTDVTVQNLIPQPLGTTNGLSAHANGVRIFFHTGPTKTAGTGSVSVVGDGTGTFTAVGQPYYQYSGATLGADAILSQNETSSAKVWTFNYDPGVTQFSFTVAVSTEVPNPSGYIDITPSPVQLAAGSVQALTGTVRTFVGAPVVDAISWGSSDEAVATVNGSGSLTAVAPGSMTVTATAGARSGTASIDVCPNLAVGGAYTFTMPVGARFCLAGGAGGNEYTVIAAHVADGGGSSIPLSITGSGITAVSGVPTPLLDGLSGARLRVPETELVRDVAFENKLHAMSRAFGGAALAGARAEYSRDKVITPGVPAVGAIMNLNVNTASSCASPDIRTGRVVSVGTHIIIVADTLNPSAGFTTAQYDSIADEFDTDVWPTITGAFGAPEDIDTNSRVVAFYTRAVNELTPEGSPSYIGGFVFSRDLFPVGLCAASNVGELFYMLVPDPAGDVNNNSRSVSFVRGLTVGVLAHEFQHLINASRRLYVNGAVEFETTWLNEGLSHIAEELMFYHISGLADNSNLGVADIIDEQDAFFSYAESNFGRYRQWLLSPHTNGPFQSDDDLATRGAIWAFLRYVYDRTGDSGLFFDLANATNSGMNNLNARLSNNTLDLFNDFITSVYADDAGIGAGATLTQPSWNFREIYAALDYTPGPSCSCAYELAVRNPSNGVADNLTLVSGGGASFSRMRVPATSFGTVTITSGGDTPSSAIRVTVLRRK